MKARFAPLALAAAVSSAQAPAPRVESTAGFSPIAPLVEAAIARHDLPGAVVLVGRGDTVVYRRAFGQRAVAPAAEAMTEDTIFDLASLTKVVATTTSVMKLMEEGRIRLNDPVATFIPEFGKYGKAGITIRHLLTHTSGLRPDLELDVEFSGAEEAIRRAVEEVPTSPPGERFIYSDINFFLLGDIVRRVSGERLDRYAKTQVFDPLGMKDTGFLPPEPLRARIAPTERCRTLAWPCGLVSPPERQAERRRRSRCRSCAASSTIRRRGAWTASPDTPACSARPRTCRASAACCSAAGVSTACACFRPRRSRG